MKRITIGADPELTLSDAKTGAPIPAWLVTKGLKHGEKELISTMKGVDVHADGVALEFNFTPVSPTAFSKQVGAAYAHVRDFVKKKSAGKYVCTAQAEITGYSKEFLAHPLAMMTGCDPDFDAYSNNPEVQRNIALAPPANGETKFFGGHIHVGYDKELCPPWAAARLMDICVYMPMMRLDKQVQRRSWHGKPGIFRPKPYGMEYRTPSNFWVPSQNIAMHIEHNISRLFEAIHSKTDKVFDFFHKVDWAKVKKIVDARDENATSDYWDGPLAAFEKSINSKFALLHGE